jgi:hypothetical protein
MMKNNTRVTLMALFLLISWNSAVAFGKTNPADKGIAAFAGNFCGQLKLNIATAYSNNINDEFFVESFYSKKSLATLKVESYAFMQNSLKSGFLKDAQAEPKFGICEITKSKVMNCAEMYKLIAGVNSGSVTAKEIQALGDRLKISECGSFTVSAGGASGGDAKTLKYATGKTGGQWKILSIFSQQAMNEIFDKYFFNSVADTSTPPPPKLQNGTAGSVDELARALCDNVLFFDVLAPSVEFSTRLIMTDELVKTSGHSVDEVIQQAITEYEKVRGGKHPPFENCSTQIKAMDCNQAYKEMSDMSAGQLKVEQFDKVAALMGVQGCAVIAGTAKTEGKEQMAATFLAGIIGGRWQFLTYVQ